MRISDWSSDVCSSDLVVAGPQYPDIDWPDNVERIDHVPPAAHADFYSSCRFSLNLTRQDMVRTGYSPSVRLFEAAACGSPIISDPWAGLEGLFMPEAEILIAENSGDILRALLDIPETRRLRSEEHTSELQSHMRISYAVLCLK